MLPSPFLRVSGSGFGFIPQVRPIPIADKPPVMSSRPEEFHLRALPEPCMNLSIHTAPDVRPLPWHKTQWAKRCGFARRNRSNQSRPPLVRWRNRLNLRRAHRMT
jgi:hypothetical protein